MTCLEIKTGKAVQSKQQKNFEKMIKRLNGYYGVVRSVDEAMTFLEEAV